MSIDSEACFRSYGSSYKCPRCSSPDVAVTDEIVMDCNKCGWERKRAYKKRGDKNG